MRDEELITRLYRAIIENIQIGLHIYHLEDPDDDKTLRMIAANSAAAEITGVPVADVLGRTLDESFPGLRDEGIPQRYASVARSGQARDYFDITYGDHRLVDRAFSVHVFGLPGDCVGAAFQDVTEQSQAVEALQDNETRLKALLGSIDEIVFEFDERGTYVNIWNTDEALLVRPRHELIGAKIGDFFDLEFTQRIVGLIGRVLKTGEPEGFEYSIEVLGGQRWFLGRISPVPAADGSFRTVCFLARDITTRKKTEEAIFQANRIESVGILAGGIAHDFNNLLTVILGNINLAKGLVDRKSRAHGCLQEAEQASLRAADLTQQLLTFSKGGEPLRRATSLEELARESADLVSSGSNVKCEYHFPSELWPVDVDQRQMSQVIYNLVINAQQAMPEGGSILIRAENKILGDESTVPLASGEYVMLVVEDHGTGIPQKHLSKIFDPFFSTKQKGRGLGLATVYSIIKNHDGHITVESEIGTGTTFTFYLAASDQPVAENLADAEEAIAGHGNILLMDDEEGVRTIVGRMLTTLGFNVETAKDGTEAIELYQSARDSARAFDLIIMDLTVPGGMGGMEAVQQLHQIDPEAKAVVSSGYSNASIMANFRKHGFSAVIAKPYRLSDLSKVLHEVLQDQE